MKKHKIIFYLKKDKQDNNGNAAIYCRISINGTEATFATGKFICPERWKVTSHLRKVLKKEEEKEIQQLLRDIERKADSIVSELKRNDVEGISAELIKATFFGKPIKQKEKAPEKTISRQSHFTTIISKSL